VGAVPTDSALPAAALTLSGRSAPTVEAATRPTVEREAADRKLRLEVYINFGFFLYKLRIKIQYTSDVFVNHLLF
jgi:hypothetical protein